MRNVNKGPGYGNRQRAYYRVSKHCLVREGFGIAINAKAKDRARNRPRGRYGLVHGC